MGSQDLLSRHEVQTGTLVFLIEARTVHASARAEQLAEVFPTEASARELDRAYFEAIAQSRELARRPSIQEIERFASVWADLVPPAARLRGRWRLGQGAAAVLGGLRVHPGAGLSPGRPGALDRYGWHRPNRCAVLLLGLGLLNVLTIAALAEAVARSGAIRYGNAFLGRLAADYLGPAVSGVLTLGPGGFMFLANVAGLIAARSNRVHLGRLRAPCRLDGPWQSSRRDRTAWTDERTLQARAPSRRVGGRP